jgi:hypothetical protein
MRTGLVALSGTDGGTLIAWKRDGELSWQLYNAQGVAQGAVESVPSAGNGRRRSYRPARLFHSVRVTEIPQEHATEYCRRERLPSAKTEGAAAVPVFLRRCHNVSGTPRLTMYAVSTVVFNHWGRINQFYSG